MNDHSERHFAHRARQRPLKTTKRPAGGTDSSTGRRRWFHLTLFAALSAFAAWATGRLISHRVESHDVEIASRRQQPLSGPQDNPYAAINAEIMRRGWVGNLDGTAVAYAAEADGLITLDGHFRTDLSPHEAAAILHLDANAIAKPGAAHDIDGHAVLFRAQAGTLTAQVKAMSRKMRLKQAAEGRTPDAAFRDWVVRDFEFTLDRLRRPTAEEEAVLTAIVRSKLLVMPKPGDVIRAIPVNRGELGPDRVALWPGMLPPEEPMARSFNSR